MRKACILFMSKLLQENGIHMDLYAKHVLVCFNDHTLYYFCKVETFHQSISTHFPAWVYFPPIFRPSSTHFTSRHVWLRFIMHWMFSSFLWVDNELMWFTQQEHMFRFYAWWENVMLNKFVGHVGLFWRDKRLGSHVQHGLSMCSVNKLKDTTWC